MTDINSLVLKNFGTYWSLVPKEKPKTPSHCGFVNEDLECLGCGVKLGCLQYGHCYAVEGKKAFKPETAK